MRSQGVSPILLTQNDLLTNLSYLLRWRLSRQPTSSTSILSPVSPMSKDFADFAEENYYSFLFKEFRCTNMVQLPL